MHRSQARIKPEKLQTLVAVIQIRVLDSKECEQNSTSQPKSVYMSYYYIISTAFASSREAISQNVLLAEWQGPQQSYPGKETTRIL